MEKHREARQKHWNAKDSEAMHRHWNGKDWK